jgi:hypothetical protein
MPIVTILSVIAPALLLLLRLKRMKKGFQQNWANAKCHYTDCRYADCCYPECYVTSIVVIVKALQILKLWDVVMQSLLIVTILTVIQNVMVPALLLLFGIKRIIKSAKHHYTDCHYPECHCASIVVIVKA